MYLLHTSGNGDGVSGLVLFSALMSFINLTASICGDDSKLLKIGFSVTKRSRRKRGTLVLTRMQFLALYAFRILEIPSKLLLYALLWYCVSGFACAVVLLIDVAVGLVMYSKTKQL